MIELPSPAEIAEAIAPLDRWHHDCHAASIALINAGVLPPSRVARGTCRGVGGQHSWVVVGNDVYHPKATIVDPTLWSYDPSVEGVWIGNANQKRHVPHGGHGSIWLWGKPAAMSTDYVTLTPKTPLSGEALRFIAMLGPLDRWAWGKLCSAPVFGWPAAEIIAAIDDTPELRALVPIDVLGMLTDRNPGGMYLPRADAEPGSYVVADAEDLTRVAARMAG